MKKILIIDDDIDIGNMLEETLIKEGYETSRAYSGTEARSCTPRFNVAWSQWGRGPAED